MKGKFKNGQKNSSLTRRILIRLVLDRHPLYDDTERTGTSMQSIKENCKIMIYKIISRMNVIRSL
jgi:hypothetical protein